MADSFYEVCGFLFHRASGKVLLHHRGSDAPLNPNKWALFGGGSEPEDAGDPVATWCREMFEELGLRLERAQVLTLFDYLSPRSGVHRLFSALNGPPRPKTSCSAKVTDTDGSPPRMHLQVAT